MINNHETSYAGPKPKDINPSFPDHTYDKIVCLLNGESKRIIQERYLKKNGSSKAEYLALFPNAPLKSNAASDSYRNAAMNDGGMRSANMRKMNLSDTEFKEARNAGRTKFLESDEGKEYRGLLSERTKEQHRTTDLSDRVRQYFKTDYLGSEDQKNRSLRMSGENNIIHKPGVIEKGKSTYMKNHNSGFHNTKKKKFKHYDLFYQGNYEYDFLEYCEKKDVIHLVANVRALKDAEYSRRFYLPDFMFANTHIIEVKSWYIEQRQEKNHPGTIAEKRTLVERLGYSWMYILDKDYSAFDQIIA